MTAPTTDKARQEARIANAINRRIRSGRPFTTDSIWKGLKDIEPGDHRNWLGQMLQKAAQAGRIECVGHTETSHSVGHSRAVKVWRGVPADERQRRMETAA
jgi:hypothetical protein